MQSHDSAWEPSQADIDRKPWKYTGYQSFSAFVASDNDFFVLRKFGALSARVLLGLQDQLSRLEQDLEALEKTAREKDAPDVHNGSFRQETRKDRQALVGQAQPLLREYNELILQHSRIRARPQVPKKDICSLDNWFFNNGNAILAEETAYTKYPSDLFSLVPTPKSPLRSLLEHSSHFRLLKLWQQKTFDSTTLNDKHIHYISDEKIDRFTATIIMTLGLIMLIAPLWILAFLGGLVQRLGVISAFIVLFVALVSVTTVTKPFESLAAAAAYSAVLMVFLQMSTN
ncbi:hypothetical protein HO133_006762 [Letharia lupina]|uniref:DUF6594 domain-containing protein n=1 Tax=Letharia lupina TaxID=560253 RepID=A0A8H6C631_9LECA|nr:uncharacterized protein HO133_006762 [Letharia lupina]KAF6217660.1 hypothetical protein HO133_006762 [Letharia lupina]